MAKRRTKRAVESIAQDLLKLYAQRETLPGHAFAPDSEWQRELEASFPYIETDDQLVAIEAVKQDMEKPQPMDRLICGDVGYGKTEVALRAAFKAIMDGKQVAVLVPTTVLAQQHFKTFSRRLQAFPVEVAMLSRFRTRKQQQETIEGLAKGSVDIVIGTHRLLSKDVEFKNLGLLIVDEEQRFGVRHKERIKQLRTQVDVLTLTATPIPRTLYMSLTGVRDLSTIETPPMERQAIQTQVGFYDETLVRNAILREMDRGGQVFFVHNRVRGIEQMANKLRKLVPEARIAVGHGQMPERELERVMLAFAEGEYDVLVSTTIIESGIDIPNANTIIINRADKFGLAQLYQLRGRVGRSAVRAYAYLLYDKTRAPLARGQAPTGGHPGGQRSGLRLPHRHARSGNPGRGRAAGLPPAWAHRRGGLRYVCAAAGPGRGGAARAGASTRDGGGHQGPAGAPQPQRAAGPAPGGGHPPGLHRERGPALAALPPHRGPGLIGRAG
jgi:transcription-repair coupling factor (superfamily II helicase)